MSIDKDAFFQSLPHFGRGNGSQSVVPWQITWASRELVRNGSPIPTELETLRVVPRALCFNKPSCASVPPKFENHKTRENESISIRNPVWLWSGGWGFGIDDLLKSFSTFVVRCCVKYSKLHPAGKWKAGSKLPLQYTSSRNCLGKES